MVSNHYYTHSVLRLLTALKISYETAKNEPSRTQRSWRNSQGCDGRRWNWSERQWPRTGEPMCWWTIVRRGVRLCPFQVLNDQLPDAPTW